MKKQGYQLTLKGWFSVRAMRCKSLDDTDEFWNDLADEVRRVALADGLSDGIPALVLEGGGHALTVRQLEEPKDTLGLHPNTTTIAEKTEEKTK